MLRIKSAKIYLCFAVLLLVAKPFLGFSMFSSTNPPSAQSIFVKAFTKRKQEYVENSNYDISTVQKKLAEPVQQFALTFSFLSILFFTTFFAAGALITDRFLQSIKLRIATPGNTYLRCGQLII
jgi:hypothetical protein